jgi:ketosteroid isomerase-like protein
VLEGVTPRDLITDYLRAARSGDWPTAYAYFADDLRVRIPGRSEWAGERVGKQHAIDYIDAAFERHAGKVEVDLVDMLASEERVVLIVRERFLGATPVEILRANAYTVHDGRIVAIDIFEGDQYDVDEHVHGT